MGHHLKKTKPFDLVIILFCLLTGFYILFWQHKLNHISGHLIVRIIFILIIILFIYTDDYKNRIFQFIRNFYPVLMICFFYSETDYYNNILWNNFDPLLVKLENIVFGSQLSMQFSQTMHYRWFSELMHFGYFSYYIMILGIPLLYYFKRPPQFEKTMFIIILSFCLYYLIFIIFPSIGPQFFFPLEERTVPEGYLFQKIMHFILETAETETGAFPSSHVGLAIIFIILTTKHFKKVLWVLIPVTILLLLSTVYIKAHYTIDIIAGIFSGGLFYIISNALYQRFIVSEGYSLR